MRIHISPLDSDDASAADLLLYPSSFGGGRTSVADTRVVDLDADFVSLWRRDLDGFDAQVFASLPRNGGLSLTCQWRSMAAAWRRRIFSWCGVLTLQVMVYLDGKKSQ
jgi:hypothetical protein